MRTKKVKSAGRFGPRYGVRVRVKIAAIESEQRKKQQCIFCDGRAKRLSKGIWTCQKCGKKFASNTFILPKKE
jgi:large subunit ribosomal protein L37Ae